MNRPRRKDLRALRDKYERILALRTSAGADPPRAELARLAREYPGALRETDALPLDVVIARIAALRSAELRPTRAPSWMLAQVTFHAYARGALATKRWLAGRKAITPAMRSAFTRAFAHEEAGLFAAELARVAQPPRGRLMDLVHAKVAEALAVSQAEARALVFGAEPREERSGRRGAAGRP